MTEQETQAIKQSMLDGYFQKGGKQPRESEINTCLRFFEQVDIIRETKEPETVDTREESLIGIFYAVMDRDVLISGFDTELGQPRFIKNNIKIQ